MAEKMNAEPPQQRRISNAPRRYQNSQSHQFDTPKDWYRSSYFEVLDNAINSLEKRISNKEIPALIAIEDVISKGWAGKNCR